jgi:UTP--glucose-1-phosphate uridylyltransferase
LKVVIPVAGLGTRLLTATKEQPKEMMPVFTKSMNGNLCVKPLLQMIFEQLYDRGFRDFCFIVGRGKRIVEDHFTPDWLFVNQLRNRGKESLASELESFYRRIESSMIVWVNQPEPKGFGHAVFMAKPFIGNEPFMVHAGDTYIVSKNGDHIERLISAHEKNDADATLLLQKVEDPRQYGVAVVEPLEEDIYKTKDVIEKPKKPISNLAIMPIYIFRPVIMEALRNLEPGVGGEIQLTDGIGRLIKWGLKVQAIELKEDEIRLDIGNPKTYWEALSLSYKYFIKR